MVRAVAERDHAVPCPGLISRAVRAEFRRATVPSDTSTLDDPGMMMESVGTVVLLFARFAYRSRRNVTQLHSNIVADEDGRGIKNLLLQPCMRANLLDDLEVLEPARIDG